MKPDQGREGDAEFDGLGLSTPDADFLRTLGNNVRDQRERRGMARRVLAEAAEVSGRYVSLLETGRGNISIVLLRRIANALGVKVSQLIGEQAAESAERRIIGRLLDRLPQRRAEDVIQRLLRDIAREEAGRRNRVAFVGLRGAGKSTLGAMLAREQNAPFIELTKQVEATAGLSLAEIFVMYGQAGYRRLEAEALERILTDHPRAVISVGGGLVAEDETYDRLLETCFTIWLKAKPEEHMGRVVAQGDQRPMAGNDEALADLRRILAAREALYRRADAIVDTSGETPDRSLAQIRQILAA